MFHRTLIRVLPSHLLRPRYHKLVAAVLDQCRRHRFRASHVDPIEPTRLEKQFELGLR